MSKQCNAAEGGLLSALRVIPTAVHCVVVLPRHRPTMPSGKRLALHRCWNDCIRQYHLEGVLEPEVALAKSYGLSDKQLDKIVEVTQEHCDEFVTAWDSFFGN